MYVPSPDDAQASGAWNPMARQSSRNRFQPAGRVIRRKELRGLQHLADGAMCSCYTAELEGHGIVVIKKPSEHSNETREEIERELDIEKAYLANLRHPHIIRLIGSGQRGLSWHFEPFLVLEYLTGGTLGHLISERRRGGGEQVEKGVNRKRGAFELPHFVLDGKKNYIPWAQAMGWARDMASALHYMHHEALRGHLYICRDLKPDNVGFAADGTLKIFDFGLAKRLKRKTGTNQRYTMTSRTGTVRYMAPEAFLGCSYNEKVDVYAWSHVVAEMLSLDVPYNQMTTHQFRETVALGSKRPHVERRWPRSIQRLLKRCWDADPVARPSFGEILKAGILEQAAGPPLSWLHHLGIHPRSTPPPTPGWEIATAGGGGGRPALRTPPKSLKSTKSTFARRPRSRTATALAVPAELHHMSARARGERKESGEEPNEERDRRGNRRSQGRSGGGGGGGFSTPPRLRLGPLHIPFCFFGGRKLEHQHSDSDDEDNAVGGVEGDGGYGGHGNVKNDIGSDSEGDPTAFWASEGGTNGGYHAEENVLPPDPPATPNEKEVGGYRRSMRW